MPLQRVVFRLFLPGLGNEQVGGCLFVPVMQAGKRYCCLARIFRVVRQHLYIQILSVIRNGLFDNAPLRNISDTPVAVGRNCYTLLNPGIICPDFIFIEGDVILLLRFIVVTGCAAERQKEKTPMFHPKKCFS